MQLNICNLTAHPVHRALAQDPIGALSPGKVIAACSFEHDQWQLRVWWEGLFVLHSDLLAVGEKVSVALRIESGINHEFLRIEKSFL